MSVGHVLQNLALPSDTHEVQFDQAPYKGTSKNWLVRLYFPLCCGSTVMWLELLAPISEVCDVYK